MIEFYHVVIYQNQNNNNVKLLKLKLFSIPM